MSEYFDADTTPTPMGGFEPLKLLPTPSPTPHTSNTTQPSSATLKTDTKQTTHSSSSSPTVPTASTTNSLPPSASPTTSSNSTSSPSSPTSTSPHLNNLLSAHSPTFIRLQWVDYANILRLRLLPISQIHKSLSTSHSPDIKITPSVFSVMQDNIGSGQIPRQSGVRVLSPAWDSLKPLWPNGRPKEGAEQDVVVHAAVMCDVKMGDNTDCELCPRSLLKQKLKVLKAEHGVSLRLGFEIEVLLLPWDKQTGRITQQSITSGTRRAAHSWSSATALLSQNEADVPVLRCLEEISLQLETAGIEVLVVHPEATCGQFEFVLGALEACRAVDTLYHARQIIEIVANQYGYRASLHPKPIKREAGTGAHVHFSLFSALEGDEEVEREQVSRLTDLFAEGILSHLKAFSAICMPTLASYERVEAEGHNYSASPWVFWGVDNKDAPLRRVEAGGLNQHFEFRTADGTANAYLLSAGLISCGLLGLREGKPLRGGLTDNPETYSDDKRKESNVTDRLATSLEAAFQDLKSDKEFCKELGEAVVENFLAVKDSEIVLTREMEKAGEDVWAWEMENY